jgi:hypothetical protein
VRHRHPSPLARPLENSPLRLMGEDVVVGCRAEGKPVGRAIVEDKRAASVGAGVAPSSCKAHGHQTQKRGDDISHAPAYHPPSSSTKAEPGLRLANAGATIVPSTTFACNWQPLPHVAVTRPVSSPFSHWPAREYDAGGGSPVMVRTPGPCRTPLQYLPRITRRGATLHNRSGKEHVDEAAVKCSREEKRNTERDAHAVVCG